MVCLIVGSTNSRSALDADGVTSLPSFSPHSLNSPSSVSPSASSHSSCVIFQNQTGDGPSPPCPTQNQSMIAFYNNSSSQERTLSPLSSMQISGNSLFGSSSHFNHLVNPPSSLGYPPLRLPPTRQPPLSSLLSPLKCSSSSSTESPFFNSSSSSFSTSSLIPSLIPPLSQTGGDTSLGSSLFLNKSASVNPNQTVYPVNHPNRMTGMHHNSNISDLELSFDFIQQSSEPGPNSQLQCDPLGHHYKSSFPNGSIWCNRTNERGSFDHLSSNSLQNIATKSNKSLPYLQQPLLPPSGASQPAFPQKQLSSRTDLNAGQSVVIPCSDNSSHGSSRISVNINNQMSSNNAIMYQSNSFHEPLQQ
jgi:hypothetical protein